MTSVDDEIAVVAERALHATNISGSPGSLIVDFFPFREFTSLSFESSAHTMMLILLSSETHAIMDARRWLQTARDACAR